MNKLSFTAASTIPIKVYSNPHYIKDICGHKIRPIHVQLNPTNKCPLSCSFCSCKNRERGEEMSIEHVLDLIWMYKSLGMKAMTITGGGDPLAFKHINETIEELHKNDIRIGLVTNGILHNNISPISISKLTWCRISLSDERDVRSHGIDSFLASGVDMSFSYVLSKKPCINNIRNAIDYANGNKFTHVRLVDDILDDSSNTVMNDLKLDLSSSVDDSIVIYQGRKKYSRGNKRCLLSLLKPNISASGDIMPCCGVQYARSTPDLDYGKEFSMGKFGEAERIYNEQLFFDGSMCEKCYYSDYNDGLNLLWDSNELKHKEFI